MIIVMRTDLNMRKGKMVSQGSHAAVKAVVENLDQPAMQKWLGMRFTKITVGVDSQRELERVVAEAQARNLITATIIDDGKTEFKGVPTMTCAVVGPATHEELEPVTGNLKLL